jgi:hypothetical protein
MHLKLRTSRENIIDSYEAKKVSEYKTFICAVDGSEYSNMAFHTMMKLRKSPDHICLFHAFSLVNEETIPEHHRKDALFSFYEHQIIQDYHLTSIKYSFDWEDRKGRDVQEVVEHMLDEYKGIRNPMTPTRISPDLYFCGFGGKTEQNSLVLGSNSNFTMRKIHIPIVIVKKECSDNSRYFLVVVDHSPACLAGFHMLVSLMRPCDTMDCVSLSPLSWHGEGDEGSYVEEEGRKEDDEDSEHNGVTRNRATMSLREKYVSEISNLELHNCEFKEVRRPHNSSFSEFISDYANQHQADFLSIAPSGSREYSYESMQNVIENVNCSVVLIH